MRRMFPLLLMLFLFAVASSAAFGQIKEITEEEYLAASSAAWAKTKSSYPFVTTETFMTNGSGKRLVETYYESKDRLYRKSTITSETGTKIIEAVEHDGSMVYRIDGGIWQSLERSKEFSGPAPRTSKPTYMLEQGTEGGKAFKRYSKGLTQRQYHLKTYSFKVDETGKIIEVTSVSTNDVTTTYEYPQQKSPIKKPKLGSKEAVNPLTTN